MLGIVVADKNELNDWPWLVHKKEIKNGFAITYFKNNCIEIFSGIGIANSAAATQLLIDLGANKIFNYGAVGACKPLKTYDIIKPWKIMYHDVFTPWYKRGVTPHEEPFFLNELGSKNSYNLVSGNSFISNPRQMKKISQEMDAHIFDMEGAAIAQICRKNKVPLYMIKCVSDVIDEKSYKKTGKTNLLSWFMSLFIKSKYKNVEKLNVRIKKAGNYSKNLLIEEIEKFL